MKIDARASADAVPLPTARAGRLSESTRVWRVLSASLLFAALLGCDAASSELDASSWGPYEPTLESLSGHEVPEWFRDAKFGIFVHYGAYSVPAYGDPNAVARQLSYAEWYWFLQLFIEGDHPLHDYHLDTFGPDTNYDDFLRMWTAEEFDAEAYADLFVRAGARYTVLVTKHHDGIALFDTRTSNRSTTHFGPGRDLVREFVDATRDAGLRVGLYYSLLEWFHPDYEGDGGFTHLLSPLRLRYPERINPYTEEPVDYLGYRRIRDFVDDHHLPQVRELVNHYDPDLLWFDGDWDLPLEYWRSYEAAAHLYNRHGRPEEVLINDRIGSDRPESGWWGDYRSFEYNSPAGIQPEYFESTRGVANSFGYNQFEPIENYLSAEEIVEMLVDIVSKNGNLLLNIGPAGSGAIPDVERALLLETGAWLEKNGDAIYSTRPWHTPGRDGVRYTTKGRTLYVHLYDAPALDASTPLSDAVPANPIDARLLGCDATDVVVAPTGESLTLSGASCGSMVWVVALSYDFDI